MGEADDPVMAANGRMRTAFGGSDCCRFGHEMTPVGLDASAAPDRAQRECGARDLLLEDSHGPLIRGSVRASEPRWATQWLRALRDWTARLRRRIGPWEPQRKRAAPVRGALDRDRASLELGQQARDREAEAPAATRATAGLIDAVEAVEDALHVLGRDARPGICDAHPRHRAVGADGERDGSAGGIANRVGSEVQEDVARPIRVSPRPHG